MFKLHKRKKDAPETAASREEKTQEQVSRESCTKETDPVLNDVTFIQEMHHTPGTWHQYDILLAARGYGWAMMVDWAAYMESADLDNVGTLTTSEIANSPEREWIEEYKASKGSLKDFAPLSVEQGVLAMGGISRTLKVPVKIVWFNQTRVLRVFTLIDDETLLTKYVETAIRRTFGTKDAMKLAKPIPKP